MRITRKQDGPAIPFEDYGFTADDFRAWHSSNDGAMPPPDKVQRIEAWLKADHHAREAQGAANEERRRRFWFGFWTLAGIVSIVVLTASFTLGHKQPSRQALAGLLLVGAVGGIAAIFGREMHRRR